MIKAGILVNFAGYPSSLDSLMPDNGLASLAGSLKAAGWKARILDYATTEMIGRLVPPRYVWAQRGLLLGYLAGEKLQRPAVRPLVRAFQRMNESLTHHAETVEAEIADEVICEARRHHVAFVGFKLWTGAGQQGALAIARRVKAALPGIRIYGGGPHVECFGVAVLERFSPVFDAVALGEGEETIVHLAEHSVGERKLDVIPGIAFARDGAFKSNPTQRIADLDTLADPCYEPETYPAMGLDTKLKLMMIDESRGCPYSCNFCFHPLKSGRKRRVRTPGRVVDQMERLAAVTGSGTYRLAGSNPPIEHRLAIAEEMLHRRSPFEYVSFGHTREEKEPFDILRRSGCVSLFYGVESCCQPILDGLNKQTSVQLICRSLIGAKVAGIMTTASLIAPAPHDTRETLQDTVDTMAVLRPHGVSIYLPMVVPGTAWFNEPERFGINLEQNAEEKLMRYQMRFLMPPPLWDPLPYTIGGKGFGEMVGEASWLSAALERRGVLSGVNDSLLIFAQKLSMPARKVRDLNRRLFMTGDHLAIRRLVARFNNAVRISGPAWAK